jgi:hypothetical protein
MRMRRIVMTDNRVRRGVSFLLAVINLAVAIPAISAVPPARQSRGFSTGDPITDLICVPAIAPLMLMADLVEAADEMARNALGLSQEQARKIAGVAKEISAKVDVLKSLPPQERRSKLIEMLPGLEKEFVARVDAMLDDEQRTKFDKLVLQFRGAKALAESNIVAELQLTKEQQQEIAAIVAEHDSRIKEAVLGGADLGPLKFASVAGMRKKRDMELLAVLTDEQQEQWKQLKSEAKIDVEAIIGKLVRAHVLKMVEKVKEDRKKKEDDSNKSESQTNDTPPPPAPPAPSKSS